MNVLFLQGGGAGAYDEDTRLAASLQKALGSSYTVHYPRMPNEDAPEYASWGPKIAEELAALDGAVMLVGHSAGAALLFQYVAEVKPDVAGLFLLAPPYWDAVDELIPNLPRKLPLLLYSSRDDEVVPFAHTERYAAELPGATVRVFDSGGHQFGDDLAEVARDIRTLRYRR